MLWNLLNSHPFHCLIKKASGFSFKKSVGCAVVSNAVYNITTIKVMYYHFFDYRYIILKVCIYAYCNVSVRLTKTCKQCHLMPFISGKFYSFNPVKFMRRTFNQTPCVILASIIDKKQITFVFN